jgi:hypothetical protein
MIFLGKKEIKSLCLAILTLHNKILARAFNNLHFQFRHFFHSITLNGVWRAKISISPMLTTGPIRKTSNSKNLANIIKILVPYKGAKQASVFVSNRPFNSQYFIFPITYKWAKQAGVFVPCKPFEPFVM